MSGVSRLGPALLIAGMILALGACGGSDRGSKDDASSGDPVSGGSVSIIQYSEPTTHDPGVMICGFPTNSLVGNALFGHLLADKADGTLEFGLAESLETSDGGTTWELTLRDDIVFSDGTPMDAEDIAYNWERLKDPQLGSTSKPFADYLDELSPDGRVLAFTLTEPIANVGYGISSFSTNWIAKSEALEAGPEAFEKNPIGAGPFTLESWTRGGTMTMAKNQEYFDSPRPYLDELVLSANGDEGQRYSTVESGGADAALSASAASYRRVIEGGLKGMKRDMNGGIPMWMNTRIAPFDDPRAREAVAKGIDLDAVNEASFGGEGVIPTTLFDEASPFHNEVPLTSFDADSAQALFDKLADEGTPVDFTITAYQVSDSRRPAEAIQASLSAFDNVDVELEILDFPAAQAKSQARDFQMMVAGLSFADPEVLLFQSLHSASSGNLSGIADAELDAALVQGRLSSDLEERKAAYLKVSERFAATNPAILYVRQAEGVSNGIVHDLQVAGFAMYGNQNSIRVDGIWTVDE